MLPLNPIWPPLDTPFGRTSGKCLADFHYIGVNYMVVEGWQSIGEVFCDNIQSCNEITAGFNQI